MRKFKKVKKMKILYYDCFSGISGDMNLGAMLDLGVSEDILRSGLESLGLDGWELKVTREQRHGIYGTMVTVVTDDDGHDDEGHNHGHHHEHGHHHAHEHEHHHEKDNDIEQHHQHRSLKDIREIINRSPLNENVKSTALKIFTKIALAESAVHNKPVEEIHFHEVGAVDSIIDIVGASICFDALKAEKIYFSDIEVGSGRVKCAHGVLPVPAPATAMILKGIPVHHGGVDFEATTPTGAAILASLGEKMPSGMSYSVLSTGYGAGHKENPSLPNMLRLYLAEVTGEKTSAHNSVLVECNVDDMNPELADYIAGRLLGSGIPDVCFIPVIMKKSRPAFIIKVICEESHLPKVREILFTESTTLGIRIIPFMKETLQREIAEVNTKYGKITVKKSWFNGNLVTVKPEADQCAALAASLGVPMKEIIREAINCAS